MAKQFLLIIGFLFSIQVMSQTGIGTATPHASAKLEVSSTDKGFLPPRVILTSTNSASPINSPANGLMVFNTATAGSSPTNVVPGYYYWDGTGQQWVSLSTTVGNVQNQAIFRSTLSTSGNSVVTSWDSRFNNIANGDLTFSSNTTFVLSNGIYKIQWGLPHQSTQTYNMMQLQENVSGTWRAWLNDANFANVANGGNTDWGGTSFMTDVIDCSSSTKSLRFTNPDGRTLLTGASFIITKLNPSVTTSTTADHLGNHIATSNIQLNNNYLSNDGGNEGVRVDNSGNVGIGTGSPTSRLNIAGGGVKLTTGFGNSTNRPSLNTSSIGNYEIRGVGSISGSAQNDLADDGFLRLSAGGGTSVNSQSSIDISGFSAVADMSNNIVMRTNGTERLRIDNSGNVNVTGKLNVTDPSGNVVTKVSGILNTGSFVQLDNVKAGPTRNGAGGGFAGLSIAAVSTTFVADLSAMYSNNSIGGSTATGVTYTTSGANSAFGWGFGQGNQSTYILNDTTNNRVYRIILMIGASFNNNFISIERLF